MKSAYEPAAAAAADAIERAESDVEPGSLLPPVSVWTCARCGTVGCVPTAYPPSPCAVCGGILFDTDGTVLQ